MHDFRHITPVSTFSRTYNHTVLEKHLISESTRSNIQFSTNDLSTDFVFKFKRILSKISN